MSDPRILNDDDVRSVRAADAVAVMLRAFRAQGAGELSAPPRLHAPLSDGSMTFTVGAVGDVYGYRSYGAHSGIDAEQVVIAHDRDTGAVRYIYTGRHLGPIRTGAIGGAAVAAITSRDQASEADVAIIGTGIQAYRQIWAISAVRPIARVRAYSRDAQRRTDFVARVSTLGVNADVVDSAEDAVRDAGIVIVATDSREPVLRTEWLRDDVHLNLLGPKADGASEYPADLVADADLVVTDSLDQLREYQPATVELDRAVQLGQYIADGARRPAGRSIFHSVGLAGTEVALLAAVGAARSGY